MPRQSAVTDLRLNNILTGLKPAVTLLNDLHAAFGTPFTPAISNTILYLIAAVENVKRNRDECVELMAYIHDILYAIISLNLKSNTGGILPPATLECIAQFTETLHKVYTFVTEQLDGNKIKHFFHQSEMQRLLKDCQAGMERALEVFKIATKSSVLTSISKIQKQSEDMQKEVLELITTLSDASDGSSSMYHMSNDSKNSSASFTMLPSQPKIFHGRESELKDVVEILHQDSARVAILGAGGMGKTSLARAALHNPDVAGKYELRVFVSCDSTTTSVELAALIGSHLGLKPGKDLTK
ncbi:hypothetical protein C8R44DRAFT_991902, partial [Mycena epipterygia]